MEMPATRTPVAAVAALMLALAVCAGGSGPAAAKTMAQCFADERQCAQDCGRQEASARKQCGLQCQAARERCAQGASDRGDPPGKPATRGSRY